MADERERTVGLQGVGFEEVEPDPVAGAEGPHPQAAKRGAHEGDRESRELHAGRGTDRGDERGKPGDLGVDEDEGKSSDD